MTALSEQLRSRHEHPFLLRPIPVKLEAMQRVAQRIRDHWPDVDTVDREQNAEKLAIAMEQRRRNDTWEGFTWSDARRTADTFFSSDLWRETRFRPLLRFLLDQIEPEPGGNNRYTRMMYRAYLKTFNQSSPLTRHLAQSLPNRWESAGLSIQKLVEIFDIFNVNIAPEKIARFMDGKDAPFKALRAAGIESPHGKGLMQAAHRLFIQRQERRIKAGECLTVTPKLLGWIKPPDHSGALQNGAELAINALLLPWIPGLTDAETIKKRWQQTIKNCLVDAYGDPRINHWAGWPECSAAAKKVILSWMTGETIKVFFDIISKADESDDDKSRMWPNRCSLWLNLYQRESITEAWFALSADGEEIAQCLERDDPEHVKIQFARNKSLNASDRKKCLLLMKIDQRWVVEGSHSFKTHVFDRGDETSVKPYQPSYTCNQFRYFKGAKQPQRIAHYKNWEDKILAAILQ